MLALAMVSLLKAQPSCSVSVEAIPMSGLQGTHSYAAAHDQKGNILIIGGRTDGLHKRRPFEAFLASDNNTQLIVFNPKSQKHYSADLSKLPTPLYEQLQSTNMEYEQKRDLLYIMGGYGYSATAGDHVTYDQMVVVEYKKVIDAIISNQPYRDYFTQVKDSRFQVTGGYLHYLQDTFYLIGGQKFMGRYNPMGPTHGPGFVQEYTNEIRKFTLKADYSIDFYKAIRDTANLHRRDYNVVKQVFPDSSVGLTAFSGVFQYTADIPWLNVLDITPGGYKVVPAFEQKLNQYHTANLAVYDAENMAMHTYFFGGMGQYTYRNNVMVEDTDVPFVKTISVVSRNSQGELAEYRVGEMPGYLGAGAEFFPIDSLFTADRILELGKLNEQKTLVGYIYGGIESDAENIFFTNNVDRDSRASNKVFGVYINFPSVSRTEAPVADPLAFSLWLPHGEPSVQVALDEDLVLGDTWQAQVVNAYGQVVVSGRFKALDRAQWPIHHFAPGVYWVVVEANGKRMSKPFRVQ